MEGRAFITVDKPPAEMFQGDSLQLQESEFDAVQGEYFDRMEYPYEIIKKESGMYAYYFDHPYPTKGQPYPGAVDVLQAAKKFLFGIASFLERHYLLAVFLYLLPGFVKRYYLKSFFEIFVDRYVMAALKPHFLKEGRYSRFPREFLRAGKVAIEKMRKASKLLKQYSESFLFMLVEIFEYDNAHRYRAQDSLGEVNKEAFMKDPSAEVARIVRLNKERERGYVYYKTRYNTVENVLRLAFMFNPDLKQLLKDFIEELDLDRVKMDEADIYHNLLRPDYDICGWPIELRQKKYIEIHNKYVSENPGRIAEGRRRRERLESSAQLLKSIEKDNATPFLLFFWQPVSEENPKDGIVKMLETKFSMNIPALKEGCMKILAGLINPPKKEEEKKEPGQKPSESTQTNVPPEAWK